VLTHPDEVSEDAIAALGCLTRLRDLNISGCDTYLAPEALHLPEPLTGLHTLHLEKPQLLLFVPVLPSLRTLDFSAVRHIWSHELSQLPPLRALPGMEVLALQQVSAQFPEQDMVASVGAFLPWMLNRSTIHLDGGLVTVLSRRPLSHDEMLCFMTDPLTV
jgi:hypothetical protein